jgi:hypothetical protein
MADKAVERTQEWRKEMREKDYEPMHIWLKITDKRLIQDKARQRHQSLAECIMDGIRALPPVTRQSGTSTTELACQLAQVLERLARLETPGDGNASFAEELITDAEASQARSFINPETEEFTVIPPYADWILCNGKYERHWKAPTGPCGVCIKARRDRSKQGKKPDISSDLANMPDTDGGAVEAT